MKNNNIPKIRFPEFTDAWEKCKFKNIAGIRKEQCTQENVSIDIELENLVSDMGIIVGDVSIRTQTTSAFKKDDVLFGRLRPYLNKWWLADCNGVKSSEIWALFSLEKVSSLFLYLLIQSKSFLEAANISSGSKMPRAEWKIIEELEVSIPPLPEQQKIGTFFRQLDRLITLHKRKWDEVILLKKALLQKMFPKNGSDFPEIRFPEFTHAWEKCKLGEVANPQQWRTLNSKEMTKSGYPVFGANDYIGFYSEYNHEKETIAITCRGATSGNITLVQAKSYITGNSMAIDELNEDVCTQDFLLYSLISRGLKDIISGSAQPQIVKKAIDQVTISYPTLPEQQKIGTFFRQLDRLITLHKRQHEHYQRLKKALLQQMFV
ncbi:restriction endonuclease subunit S [Avibacterium sp. 21-595]|uniref:restriction endonuclease subunit S n=1 Tax=Avibacterium sp. 21-595 TaxID=2911527 RepID=UPI002025F678|nr:restriction endonuclease subunit S [Avibacterium sp. 21-595]URL06517.1 restriction endonuclease subunit S [Avibacterium sp. 21-595]